MNLIKKYWTIFVDAYEEYCLEEDMAFQEFCEEQLEGLSGEQQVEMRALLETGLAYQTHVLRQSFRNMIRSLIRGD